MQARWRTRYRNVVGREDEGAEPTRDPGGLPRGRGGRWLARGLVLLSLFGTASLFTGPGGFVRIRNLESELALVTERNFDLVQSAHRLQAQLDRLRTDDGAIERLARRQLLVRDGETLYQLGDDARRRDRPATAARGERR